MALEKLLESVEIIQQLGDNPNTDNNLSAELLKMKFDEAAGILKRYLNEQVVPYINTLDSAFTESLDPTLTEEKKAAQAKAVGDALAANRKYVDAIVHIYRGSYAGDIDSTDLNGLYWIVKANCTGTFPSNHTYSILEATERHQKLLGYTDNGIGAIFERYYVNSKWYGWKQTDSINSVPISRTINGKALTNDIALSAADVGAPTTAEAAKGKLVPLWTNSSPTSSFAAQTVSLDLSGYNYVLVCATWDINNPHRTLPCHIAQVGGAYDGGYLGGRNPSSGAFVGRSMDVASSGVAFAGGYSGTTSDNKVCIPFAIFGIDI